MRGWRGSWAAAQLTGVLFSSFAWLVFAAMWPIIGLAGLVIGICYLLGRNSRAGLRWRFGVRSASVLEQRMLLAGIVPIAALRGRRQPAVWVSRRLGGLVLMPTGSDLVIGEQLATGVVADRVPADEFSALVAHALGQQPVHNSRLMAGGDVYCLPWRLVEVVVGGVSPVVRRVPLTGFAWRVRWVVFGFALVDAARHGRWYAFVGVAIIAILSWSTSYLNRRWVATLTGLGDEQVRATGLGDTLAAMIRRQPHTIGDLERAAALTSSRPDERLLRR